MNWDSNLLLGDYSFFFCILVMFSDQTGIFRDAVRTPIDSPTSLGSFFSEALEDRSHFSDWQGRPKSLGHSRNHL